MFSAESGVAGPEAEARSRLRVVIGLFFFFLNVNKEQQEEMLADSRSGRWDIKNVHKLTP